EDRDVDVREEHTDHLDVCLEHPHEDHRQDTGIDQLDREPRPRPADLRMGKGNLYTGGFNVNDDEEDGDGGDESKHIRAEVGQVVASVKTYRYEAGEEPNRVLVINMGPADKPVYECLGNTRNNEQTHTGADTPLGHYLIHEEDEDATDTDLNEDQEGHREQVASEELVCNDRIGLQETSDEVRCCLHNDHDNNQDLLQAHVHDLATRFARVDVQDICTLEELEYDGCRNDRSDTEMNNRTACTGKEGTVRGEDIRAVGCQSEQRDVCQDKVQD